ncbi:MAG: hypothetical protein HQ534_00540 [Armatimonadetes bacterium]|nr:hypothetical protein [Armatimonadota bacterium]
MDKDLWYTIASTMLGSLIEEGTKEIFPSLDNFHKDVGELEKSERIPGFIVSLFASPNTKDETRNSIKTFVRFAYKEVNIESANDNVSEEELKLFSENFNKVPKDQKKQIISDFKNLAHDEYVLILDFLENLYWSLKWF